MTFYNWMKQYDGEDSPRGDLIYDMKCDKGFPKNKKSFKGLLTYLADKHACTGAVETFIECWVDYMRDETGY